MKIRNKIIALMISLIAMPTFVFAQKGKLGLRYWHSEGETEYSHCASTACGSSAISVTHRGVTYTSAGDPTSKLNYSGTKAGIGEIFGTYEINKISLMAKYGTEIRGNDGGKFRDQDWVKSPTTGQNVEFSDTLSDTRNTKVNYYTADLGMLYDANITGTKITPFLGYVRYKEKLSAYGAVYQPDDISYSSGNASISNSTLVLQNDITWTGFRIGVDVDYPVNKEFSFNLNAAYVFGLDADNKDSHVLRTSNSDLGPAPNIKNVGNGDYGYMIDVLGQYKYSPQLAFDFGYRWWMFDTDSGNTKFGPTFNAANTWPNRSLKSERSGLLIGANYSF